MNIHKETFIKVAKDFMLNYGDIDVEKDYEKWVEHLSPYIYTLEYAVKCDEDWIYCNRKDVWCDYTEEEKEEIEANWDEWIIGFVEADNDYTEITDDENGQRYFFRHNQECLDISEIEDFYETYDIERPLSDAEIKQQKENKKMLQAYYDLNISYYGFKRFKALLHIFKNDFGEQKIYWASNIDKVRKQLLYCINDVLDLINDNIEDGSIRLWIPNHTYSNEEDEHYCELIYFGGYEILSDGQTILDSDVIILKDEESIQSLDCYKYENMDYFFNYIEEVFEYYEKDVRDVYDREYEKEINEKLNNIINQYWQNTIEFDYAEMMEMIQ